MKRIRNLDQAMGFWLNEPAISDHDRIAAAMADLGRSGFGVVRIMTRQTCFHHRSPEVVAAVATAVEHGHRHGLRVVYDCESHAMVARQIGQADPGALGQKVFRGEGPLRDGAFRVDLHLPERGGLTFDHVIQALVDDGGGLKPIPVPECSLVWETSMSPLGIADDRQEYAEGKPLGPRRHVRLSGRIEGARDGRIVLYFAALTRELVDFAAPGTRDWYRGLIADFSHIPLDGVCWDEPAAYGDWESYRYGRAFARAFAEKNGYELATRIHLLDTPGQTPAAVQVRLDYYRTLNETLFEAQADFLAAARAAFGPDILTGTHHTWQGEGGINDYRSGAVDYFRLNDQMDAGYTDCCWWDPRSVAYSYVLGSSLGRLTPSGECECNTWHWKPTVRSTLWNARLMSLMHITWFNIWYGDDCDTVLYPAHYAWPAQVECMQRHRQWQQWLGGARPAVEIAVLHDWQAVCGANLVHTANLHKAFCMNFSWRAQGRSGAFDFIDARLLAGSAIEDDQLVNDLGRYRVLVVPGASVLDRASWTRIAAFVGAGGKVVFCGPPPSVDEKGDDLTADFAALMGIEPLHADAYDAWFRQTGVELPQARPDRFDLAYPIPMEGDRAIASTEGDIHGVHSPCGKAVWFSGYEASEPVLAELRRSVPPPVACHSATVLWRLYRDGDRQLLMLVAAEDEELTGIVEFAGWRLRLNGGTCIGLEITPDGDATVQRDRDEGQAVLERIAP